MHIRCFALVCLIPCCISTVFPEHKDTEEKKGSGKGSSDERPSEPSKFERMEVEPPKAELNGATEDLHSEGDTQSN